MKKIINRIRHTTTVVLASLMVLIILVPSNNGYCSGEEIDTESLIYICANMFPFPCNCPNGTGQPGSGGGGPKKDEPNSGTGQDDMHPMTGGSISTPSAGDPVDIARSAFNQDVEDLSIPVRHGLKLEVRRTYSSRYMNERNWDGEVTFGYSHNGNWHFYLYESRIVTTPIVEEAGYLYTFITENGNWFHFFADPTPPSVTLHDSDKLYAPNGPWGQTVHATKWIAHAETAVNNYHFETNVDAEMYILYSDSSETTVTAYTVRYGDGRQYHFDSQGNLVYVDANWRNNVNPSATGHVDDYIQVEWENFTSQLRSELGTIRRISRIDAPPSDGRYLQFNYYTNSSGSRTSSVGSIDFYSGLATYNSVVRYTYCDDAYIGGVQNPGLGKLKRALSYSPSQIQNGTRVYAHTNGIQYDYGTISFSSNTTATINYTSYDNPKICQISKVDDNVVSPYLINRYDTKDLKDHWFKDNDGNDWRKAFESTGYSNPHNDFCATLYYYDGQKYDGSGRYNGGTYSTLEDNPHTDFNTNTECDELYKSYANTSQEFPKQRLVYYTSGSFQQRLVDREELFVGTNEANSTHWVTLKKYTYVDPDSGIGRLASVTQYATYSGNSTSGWTADESSAQTTSYVYSTSDPRLPVMITQPDGKRTEMAYNSSGQVTSQTLRAYNSVTGAYDPVSVTAYTYDDSSAVLFGHLLQVTITPTQGGAPAKTTTYNYYGDNNYSSGHLKGMVSSVVADGQETDYTYDDWGNVKTSQARGVTTTYTYSPDGPYTTTTAFLPPRVIQVQDSTGRNDRFTFDTQQRKVSQTNALNQTTSYTYDNQGYIKTVSTPGAGTVTYTTNIYGHLRELNDGNGNITKYEYDEFGQLKRERARNAADSADLYTIEYTYGGSGGSSCGSCGGGQDKVTQRKIINGADSNIYETIYYKYDLLGRLAGQGTTSAADDYIYVYAGYRLDRIEHNDSSSYDLWGSGKLEYQYDYAGRLWREVYPNGRYIEYGYDASGRLDSIKDPFGFINTVSYDNAGRLYQLAHSTLGTAALTYNNTTDDLLTRLTLGNGAYTQYSYDSYQRLNQFELEQTGSPAMFFHHDWDYDALGRKTTLTVNVPGLGGSGTLAPTYDSASRLTRETLVTGGTGRWDVQYGYDSAGNRTSFNPGGGTAYTLGYNGTGSGQNRESSVASGTALSYDYKGNVTARPPLAGGNAYNYLWDAYDRLRQSSRSGGTTVTYAYDALGRLLKRTSSSGETTLNYWLGLNKIAEERGGAESVFRPDSEEGSSPQANGWCAVRAAAGAMTYTTDAVRGKVLHLDGGTFLLGGVSGYTDNPNGGAWGAQGNYHVGLWIRNTDANHYPIRLGVLFQAYYYGDQYNCVFDTAEDVEPPTAEGCLYNFISGSTNINYNDGQWHYLELDMGQYGAEYDIDLIHGLVIRGNVDVDDIVVSAGALGKSYQFVPGITLCGCLGAYGLNGFQENAWYYQYNDLGTVMATTDKLGHLTSVSEPDHFGNYRYTSGTRPDTLGLTGKFLDSESGLDYFNARNYNIYKYIFVVK